MQVKSTKKLKKNQLIFTTMEEMTDFQRFIKVNKLKQIQVAEYLGTSPQYVNQVANGKCALSDDKYELLAKSSWDTSMLTFPSYIKVPASVMSPYTPDDTAAIMSQQEVMARAMEQGHHIITDAQNIGLTEVPAEIVEEIEAKVIAEVQPPYVPLTVARHPNLDVMEWLKKGNGRHVSSTFNIMSILNDTTFYTEVRSNAMSPALNQGEILFLKEFEEGFVFVDGSPYVIDTRSRGMLAFYLYDRGDYIEARPHNVRFETLTIAKTDIMRYYQILFHGSTWVATELPTGDCHRQVEKQTEQISTLIGELGKAGDRVDKMGEQVSRVLDMMGKKL